MTLKDEDRAQTFLAWEDRAAATPAGGLKTVFGSMTGASFEGEPTSSGADRICTSRISSCSRRAMAVGMTLTCFIHT